MNIKKIAAVMMCGLLTFTAFTGCGEKEEEQAEETFYGQAMKEVSAEDIYRIYDGRYVSDEEADALASYYYAIQTEDEKLFESVQPEPYTNYLKKQGEDYIRQFMSGYKKADEEMLGGEFVYSKLEITDCGDSKIDNGLNETMELLDGIYEEMGADTTFSETVESSKYVTFTLTATLKDDKALTEYTLAEQILYIYNCKDGIYII